MQLGLTTQTGSSTYGDCWKVFAFITWLDWRLVCRRYPLIPAILRHHFDHVPLAPEASWRGNWGSSPLAFFWSGHSFCVYFLLHRLVSLPLWHYYSLPRDECCSLPIAGLGYEHDDWNDLGGGEVYPMPVLICYACRGFFFLFFISLCDDITSSIGGLTAQGDNGKWTARERVGGSIL